MAHTAYTDIELKVEGMTCTNCALGVKRYIEKEGGTDISVDFAGEEARFKLAEPEKLPVLIKGIQRLGYDVKEQSYDQPAEVSTKGMSAIEKKFYFCLVFTIPLLLHMFLPFHLLHNEFFQLALTIPVYAVGAWHFGRSAWHSLKSGVPNMDVLIIIGATAAFAYSLTGTIQGLGSNYLFYETAASIITIVLLGNLMEHRAVRKTTSSIEALIKLQSPVARLVEVNLHTGQETLREIEARQIKEDYILQVNTGDSIPADGIIMQGDASVDESMISGESLPVEKRVGDTIMSGTLLAAGSFRMRATAVGKATVLAQIIDMVKAAQARKPAIQNMADRVSAIFVPAVLGISLLTFAVSYLGFGVEFQPALLRSIAVLVIACPCAMGLAVPTAVVVGIGKAARNGVLIKGADTLERIRSVKRVVFDKTGTLTTGRFRIKEIELFNSTQDTVKDLLFNLEKHSSHPIATSLVHELEGRKDIAWQSIEEVKGQGLQATDTQGSTFRAGSWQFIKNHVQITLPNPVANIYLAQDADLLAAITVEDEIKPDAKHLISYLTDKGIESILLSGDRKEKCDALAAKLGISKVYAEQLPQDKLAIIQQLTDQAPTAMVGDGINDAPALARATVGISLSNATQVAVQSAQVILLKGSLKSLERAFDVGNDTIKVIKQNLFWAFFYNVCAIPLAAIGMLSPMIAALAMAFSDVVVIFNSLRLKYKK
jgi:P-type Cu+ transporter